MFVDDLFSNPSRGTSEDLIRNDVSNFQSFGFSVHTSIENNVENSL